MILVVGSINMDVSLQVTSIPRPGETVMSHGILKSPGGKGANQAVAAAKMGGRVAMLGCVGSDEHGSILVASMNQSGVNTTDIQQISNVPSSTAYICVSSCGENSIVVDSSANMHVTPELLHQKEYLFEAADYCVLQMEIPIESVRTAVALSRKHNTKILLNPSPLNNFDISLLDNIDFLIPNETEAASLIGKPFSETTDNDFLKLMKQHAIRNMVVTLGSDGAKLYDSTGNVTPFRQKPCKAIDTTGAGDTFLGAFVASIDSGMDLEQAIQLANVAAGISVTRNGAQSSMPCKEEVLTRIAE